MTSLAINGRFLTRPLRGVNRVAVELTQAILRMQATGRSKAPDEVVLLAPENIREDDVPPELRAILRRVGRKTGVIWEQFVLPKAAGESVLFNPCNAGPVFHKRQITLVHDAQVFTAPQSYSRGFRAWYRVSLPLLARNSGIVATVSRNSLQDLEHFGVFPKGKGKILPNGADHLLRVPTDLDTLARFGLDPGGFFLTIGSLAPHKNIKTAILAAEAARVKLVVAGGVSSKVFQSASLPQSNFVQYLGRVTDGELRALYETAAALVFPSLREGFGLPPLEAMLCGCPVIASDIETLREIGQDALLMAPPTDFTVYADYMRRLSSDPLFRAQRVEGGYQAGAHYTWESSAQKLLQMAAMLA